MSARLLPVIVLFTTLAVALVLAQSQRSGSPAAAESNGAEPAGETAPAGEIDYLDADLRRRVERLKNDVAVATNDLDELADRLQTVWQWGNAYAMTGGPIPVDFPTTISRGLPIVRGKQNTGRRGPTPRVLNLAIQQLVREFAIKENPAAIGPVELSRTGPFPAASAVTVHQAYTIGEMPMQPGGGIVLGGQRTNSYQADHPDQQNYVTVRCSRPGCRLELTEPWAAWRGIYLRASLAFRLTGQPLQPGDRITVTYGDRSGGGPGMRVQSFSNDRVLLPLYVDLEGTGTLLTPRWPAFQVVGQHATERVSVVAPSIVAVNEKFEIAVRGEDRFKNLASGSAPGYEVLLNDQPWRQIAADAPSLTVLRDVQLVRPGVYRFSVRSTDGTLAGRSNPVWVRDNPESRIYWGDTHGHTGFAEGQGSPDGYFRFGRDVARLDFLSLSEHDIWMDDYEWRTLKKMVQKYVVPGKFSPILGYEWTARNQIGGHHNVYFRDADEDRQRVPLQEVVELDELYGKLRQLHDSQDVLIVPHAHQAGDWRNSDPSVERLAEITSGHGTFEFFGNKYLQNGYQVGFIGSSDNHVGHPGYTGIGNSQQGGLAAVWATENTPPSIFAALQERQTYATTGERIIVDMTLNDGLMGTRIADTQLRRVHCRVYGTNPIDSIDLIKNGQLLYRRRYATADVKPQVWVQVTFASSTEVFSRANPRGSRPWRGLLRVDGARLLNFWTPEFVNPLTNAVQRDASDPNQLSLAFATRGRGKSILLELVNASAETRIDVQLQAARERAGSPGAPDRPPAPLPAENFGFQLGQLPDGFAAHELRVFNNTDRVSVQLVSGSPALDQEFTYVDRDDPQPGDYYYLRVRQLDGSMAWSSPIWVGTSTATRTSRQNIQ